EGVVSFPKAFDDDVLGLSSFRNELRNLITRAGELGLSPEELEEYGKNYNQPLWVATAALWGEYLGRLAREEETTPSVRPPLRNAQRLDHSQLVSVAVDMLEHWAEEAGGFNVSIKPVRKPQWDYVFVDDLHNAPRSIMDLIVQLRHSGTRVICAGNPDSSVQGFRGAVFSLPLDICAEPSKGIHAHPYVLSQRYRAGEKSSRALANIWRYKPDLHGDFSMLRTPNAGAVDDVLIGQSFTSEAEEAAGIAGLLRSWHLRDGIAYSDMAVLTRSHSAHEEIRRELRRRNIPVATVGSQRPLAEHPAVFGLIELISLALHSGVQAQEPENLDVDSELSAMAEKVRNVLLSPLFGLSPFDVDMLSGRLYSYEHFRGWQGDKKDVLALLATEMPAKSGIEIVDRFRSIISSISDSDTGDNAEEVLWCAWDSCAVADAWQKYALGDSEYSELAGDNLDAILQLFYFVQREVDRAPGVSIAEVVDNLKAYELPQDSLVGGNKKEDSVTLITPASAQGRQFSCIVVAHLNEGVWPNMTVRDAFLHTDELSDVVLGRYVEELTPSQRFRSQMLDVLDDELRQLYAGLGQACHRVALTCVANSQSRPSRFLGAMGFVKEKDYNPDEYVTSGNGDTAEPFILEQRNGDSSRFDMTGLVGKLRRYSQGEGNAAGQARELLKYLAARGVLQAEPALWFDAYKPTTCQGREGTISVSPSRVEATLECPLRGIMQGFGFEDKSDRKNAEIGTIIHAVAAEYKDGGRGELSNDELRDAMLASFNDTYKEVFGEDLDAWGEKEKETYSVAIERLADFLYERRVSGEYRDVKAEYRFAFDEGDAHVTGSIDRLEISEDASFIYDYKTGKTPLKAAEAQDNPQLQIYQLAIARDRAIPQTSGAKLLYPNTTKTKIAERLQSPIDEEKVLDRIARYVDYGKSGVLPAQDDDNKCDKCRY
ncbi:MAG: ATP-dependent helicase, partial [Actinomycetaceae bacterium]|nr:ATP-dependent helicase [Actinomycetaceae bacterium]